MSSPSRTLRGGRGAATGTWEGEGGQGSCGALFLTEIVACVARLRGLSLGMKSGVLTVVARD